MKGFKLDYLRVLPRIDSTSTALTVFDARMLPYMKNIYERVYTTIIVHKMAVYWPRYLGIHRHKL